MMISSCSRGEVAPVISASPWKSTSEARESSAGPSPLACTRSRSSWSEGTPGSTASVPVGTAFTRMRSRIRSERSSTKRRGSCPDSTTRSTVVNSDAPSPAA